MKALAWFGTRDVRVIEAPVPDISEPDDVILRVTGTTICGSDLHLYNGEILNLQRGDILGHEVSWSCLWDCRAYGQPDVVHGCCRPYWPQREEPPRRSARRRVIPDRLRRLRILQAEALVLLRPYQPVDVSFPDNRRSEASTHNVQQASECNVRPQRCRILRLFPLYRWLPRRPGRVRPCTEGQREPASHP